MAAVSSSRARCNHYDVVIIGAGMAGLTAAAFLAQGGAQVLVCEQSSQVGGLFNSFQLDGYQFDGGIKAVENSAVLKPMLTQLQLLERIPFHDSSTALITSGRIQPIRSITDVNAYFHLLAELFTEEKAGLMRILRDTNSIFDVLDGFLSFPIPFFDTPGSGNQERSNWVKKHTKLLGSLPRIAPWMKQELRSYLQHHLHSPGLINLLGGLFPQGTSVFFGLGYFRMFLDYFYPLGGIQTVPLTMADAIRAWGGELLLNTRVEHILLSGGKACGIKTEEGGEITAGHVVAACDLYEVFTRLLPQTAHCSGFVARLLRAEPSHSVFNVFLGIDMPVERMNLRGCQHLFYAPDLEGITDPDRVNRADYFTHVPQEISVPCLHEPNLAPAGKTGINISAMTTWHYAGGWEQEAGDYASRNQAYADQMIDGLSRFIPNLRSHIELCNVATPRTVYARTSNYQGAIMGWTYDRKHTLKRGSFLQMRNSIHTPVPCLLVAGHWAFSPGGSPTAILTGKLAAESILKNRV